MRSKQIDQEATNHTARARLFVQHIDIDIDSVHVDRDLSDGFQREVLNLGNEELVCEECDLEVDLGGAIVGAVFIPDVASMEIAPDENHRIIGGVKNFIDVDGVFEDEVEDGRVPAYEFAVDEEIFTVDNEGYDFGVFLVFFEIYT